MFYRKKGITSHFLYWKIPKYTFKKSSFGFLYFTLMSLRFNELLIIIIFSSKKRFITAYFKIKNEKYYFQLCRKLQKKDNIKYF